MAQTREHGSDPRPTAAEPIFSTVMPVYNHAEYVAMSVRSVIEQTCSDWELIIVDDGSTDGSGRVIDELADDDARIRAIHQDNAGPAAARNAGIRLARGRWLTFLDSDDLWRPDALAGFARYTDERPSARFIYGYRHRLNEDGTTTAQPGEYQDRPTGTAELFGRMHLAVMCVCCRRDLVLEAGLYDETLRACEDYDLFLRMSLLSPLEPLGRPVGLRRRHGKNVSRPTGRLRMLEADVLRRFVDRDGGAKVLDGRAVRRRLGRLYCSAARHYLRARRYRQAVRAARLANQCHRTLKSTLVAWGSRLLCPLEATDDGRAPQP
ncbi:MAG TPA: glycosyltransferase family A protein [Phycisphaerae bacterium]|nr:glycosyltransferase family A protein [Phycisphaerae bacterium]